MAEQNTHHTLGWNRFGFDFFFLARLNRNGSGKISRPNHHRYIKIH